MYSIKSWCKATGSFLGFKETFETKEEAHKQVSFLIKSSPNPHWQQLKRNPVVASLYESSHMYVTVR